jgi:hypothetical protein
MLGGATRCFSQAASAASKLLVMTLRQETPLSGLPSYALRDAAPHGAPEVVHKGLPMKCAAVRELEMKEIEDLRQVMERSASRLPRSS